MTCKHSEFLAHEVFICKKKGKCKSKFPVIFGYKTINVCKKVREIENAKMPVRI